MQYISDPVFFAPAVVLDIGGTAIKSAYYEQGSLLDIREEPTPAALGPEHLMQTAGRIVASYLEIHQPQCIGISTAGQVDPGTGTIIYANSNLPGYTGTHVKEYFENQFSMPVSVDNDVNCAAIGEAYFGAGRGAKDFACLTYGTGVGGALFLDGELYRGSSCSAGEFGAVITHPEDRNPSQDMYAGCYEKYASVTALVKRALTLSPDLTSGKAVFAAKDDPSVASLIEEWIMEIVYGLTSIVHIFNPSLLILGGGIMEQAYLPARITAVLRENIMPSYRHVQVKGAALGNRAGMLGAAALSEYKQEIQKKSDLTQNAGAL